MNETGSNLVVGIMLTIFGVIGAIMAANARDVEILIFGLSLAVFAVVFVIALIRRHYDSLNTVAKGPHHG